MIKRMREGNAPPPPMANPDEARLEAPGLRVGASAWKWPPVWPYDRNFFKRQVEIDEGKNGNGDSNNPLSNPMAMMTGGGGGGDVFGNMANKEEGEEVDGEGGGSKEVFDSLQYWQGKSEVRTELDERVAEKITK